MLPSDRFYTKIQNKTFRYPFSRCDVINRSYSQAMQDIMILSLTKGKTNGTYLEIGCNVPDHTNNTYVIAELYGWKGISLDYLQEMKFPWKVLRPESYFVCENALTVNYNKLLGDYFKENKTIDYLQLDVDPSINTLKTLERLPMKDYRFGFISYETDVYLGNQKIREKSRKIFSDLGYTLLVGDVIVEGDKPYEDWWVDINLVDSEIANDIIHRKTSLPEEILFV
ncbi:hypothetical protein EB118_14225 [bacterium]|nr:hypothetical protein [bacterium]